MSGGLGRANRFGAAGTLTASVAALTAIVAVTVVLARPSPAPAAMRVATAPPSTVPDDTGGLTTGPPTGTPAVPTSTTAPPVHLPAAPVAGTTAPPATFAPRQPAADARSTVQEPAALIAGSPAGFAFEATNPDGAPVRWNPCAPIHYVLNLAEAPPTAASDVVRALADVAAATGITFLYDGPTTEVPARNRPSVQPDRYGKRWAPLLIAWSHAGESDELPGGRVVGEGGATSIGPAGGDQAYVTGEVVIDAHNSTVLPAGFGRGPTMGQLLLHELGHVVGLGHTSDQAEIMYPTLLGIPSATFAAGDLAGLGRLGRAAGCVTTLQP